MAEWPYNTAAWKALRLRKLSENPVCEPCARGGRTTEARAVDHIVSIASGGDAFPSLDGLMSMCTSCHSVKTSAKDRAGGSGIAFKGCDENGLPLDPQHPSYSPVIPLDVFRQRARERSLPLGMRPSRIPLVIVCGPPGSGKSTYVRQHAGPRDLVIDLDVIRSGLAGRGIHAEADRWTSRALDERNRLLRGLSSNRRHERAWFILGGAKQSDRDHWANMLGAERVHVLDVDLAECERRIRADPTRRGREGVMIEWARQWFAAQPAPHTPLQGRGTVEEKTGVLNANLVSSDGAE